MSEKTNPENNDNKESVASAFDKLSQQDKQILRRYLSTSEENHSPGGLFYQDTRKLLEKYNDLKYKSYEERRESLYVYLENKDFLPLQKLPSYLELLEQDEIYNSFLKRNQRITDETLSIITELLVRIDNAFELFCENEESMYVDAINIIYINTETCSLTREEKANVLGLSVQGYYRRVQNATKKYSTYLWGIDGINHRSYGAKEFILNNEK